MLIDDRSWKCYFNILAVFTDHGHNGVWCENVVLFDYDPVHKTRTSFFPKLISEQCESLCTRHIIFETRLNQPWVLTVGQNVRLHVIQSIT